jgi:hypothetical protein
MKLYIKLFVFILGIQNVSACIDSGFAYDVGLGPKELATIALTFICIEFFILYKFVKWLFFTKESTTVKKNTRRVVYGLLLIPSTFIFIFTVNYLPGFLYITNCVPAGTTTITIPEINFSTTTLKDRN